MSAVELAGGGDDSGAGAPVGIRVGGGGRREVGRNCNVRRDVESFPGAFEFNVIVIVRRESPRPRVCDYYERELKKY